jgi:peptidyl-prolyl cis-trans isomerase B (cyclophilin B)
MDAVHRVEKVRTNPWNNRPLRPVVMKKVTVDTRGIDYPEPEKV